MRQFPILREPMQSIPLPHNVPARSILGQRGKIIKHICENTGATVTYVAEDHRMDISGRPRHVEAAANLVHKTVEHFQYSGYQFTRKEVHNILSPEFSSAPSVQLTPFSRPIVTIVGTFDGFALSPDPPGTSALNLQAASRSSPAIPLLRPASDLEGALAQLIDLSVNISLEHPADCDRVEVRFYLGKLALCEVRTSARCLPPEALLEWNFQGSARGIFDTTLPQATVISLNNWLTSRGLASIKQVHSASLHLETSIPWVQYHPTFAVNPDGSLSLAKLETLGCKPFTLAMVGPANQLDVRMRYVATTQHREDDEVAAELRRRQGEFGVDLRQKRVTVPDLRDLDLTLTSARVKLKRTYASAAPLPPPRPSANPAAEPASVKKRRTKRAAAAEAEAAAANGAGGGARGASLDDLPSVHLRVAIAAVVDNLGMSRLEVTASCPDLNQTLMDVHRQRRCSDSQKAQLALQLRAALEHISDLRRHVEFKP